MAEEQINEPGQVYQRQAIQNCMHADIYADVTCVNACIHGEGMSDIQCVYVFTDV